jgi:hypothetical protein
VHLSLPVGKITVLLYSRPASQLADTDMPISKIEIIVLYDLAVNFLRRRRAFQILRASLRYDPEYVCAFPSKKSMIIQKEDYF